MIKSKELIEKQIEMLLRKKAFASYPINEAERFEVESRLDTLYWVLG